MLSFYSIQIDKNVYDELFIYFKLVTNTITLIQVNYEYILTHGNVRRMYINVPQIIGGGVTPGNGYELWFSTSEWLMIHTKPKYTQ